MFRILTLAALISLAGPAQDLRAQSVDGGMRIIGVEARVASEAPRGAPIFEVMINGKGPYKLLLDTGVSFPILLSPDVIQDIGLVATGSQAVSDPSGRNPVTIPTFAGLQVTIGGMTFENVSGARYGGPGVDGIVGAGLFGDLRVTLDYGRSQVIFDREALPPADGETIHDFRLSEGGAPTVDLNVGGGLVAAHIDIGQTVTPFILPETEALALPRQGDPRHIATARTVSNVMEVMAVDLTVPVRLNQQDLGVATAAYPSLGNTANLGGRAFAGGVVIFDYPNRRMQILP